MGCSSQPFALHKMPVSKTNGHSWFKTPGKNTPLSPYNFKQWAATTDQLNSLLEWKRAHILSRDWERRVLELAALILSWPQSSLLLTCSICPPLWLFWVSPELLRISLLPFGPVQIQLPLSVFSSRDFINYFSYTTVQSACTQNKLMSSKVFM